jgi:hypothetical protein
VLAWNQRQVRKLAPIEIWLFIIGRVLIGLGAGMAVAFYLPSFSRAAAVPLIALGVICLLAASRGLFRRVEP